MRETIDAFTFLLVPGIHLVGALPAIPTSKPDLVKFRRGGVAAGEPSNNPTDSTYAAGPPSSTYHHGPTIAGSTGGFWSLLFGLIAVVSIATLAGWFIIRRRRRQKATLASQNAAFPSSLGAGAVGQAAGGRNRNRRSWGKHEELPSDDEDDAFELGKRDKTGVDPHSHNVDPWVSTASTNLGPGSATGTYRDRFATSDESLNFESAQDSKDLDAGGYLAVQAGRAPSPMKQ